MEEKEAKTYYENLKKITEAKTNAVLLQMRSPELLAIGKSSSEFVQRISMFAQETTGVLKNAPPYFFLQSSNLQSLILNMAVANVTAGYESEYDLYLHCQWLIDRTKVLLPFFQPSEFVSELTKILNFFDPAKLDIRAEADKCQKKIIPSSISQEIFKAKVKMITDLTKDPLLRLLEKLDEFLKRLVRLKTLSERDEQELAGFREEFNSYKAECTEELMQTPLFKSLEKKLEKISGEDCLAELIKNTRANIKKELEDLVKEYEQNRFDMQDQLAELLKALAELNQKRKKKVRMSLSEGALPLVSRVGLVSQFSAIASGSQKQQNDQTLTVGSQADESEKTSMTNS